MEYQYKYKDTGERQTKIIKAESKGYRMLHDNFDDPKWKRGDPIKGTMIFTDVIEPSPPIEPGRDLATEIDELKARMDKLEK